MKGAVIVFLVLVLLELVKVAAEISFEGCSVRRPGTCASGTG